jgi:transcriptional regulator with XRE-family HTH domain
MRHHTLTERVRARLLELQKDGRFSQSRVARRVGVDPSAINRTLRSDKAITLDELEAFAQECDLEPAELIAPPGTLKQLNADEAEILRAMRMWPQDVRDALRAFLRYFADEKPADQQSRNLHQLWRGLRANDRGWIFGVVQLVREGVLTPDLQEQLADQLITERQKRRAYGATTRGKHRRETDDA